MTKLLNNSKLRRQYDAKWLEWRQTEPGEGEEAQSEKMVVSCRYYQFSTASLSPIAQESHFRMLFDCGKWLGSTSPRANADGALCMKQKTEQSKNIVKKERNLLGGSTCILARESGK
jgi:hypothetical protein